MLNPQVTNILIMIAMMGIARFLDFEDATTVRIVRAMYFGSMGLSLLIYHLARMRIQRDNDLALMKFVSPGNSLFGEGDKFTVTTVRDYDLADVNGATKSAVNNVAMMCFMHFYMGYTNPLFMQCVNPLKGALENKVVKIHVFNRPATGALKRPFRAEPLFGKVQPGSADVKTDKKTIESYERAGNGGMKRD